MGEVGVAVLRCSEDVGVEVYFPELDNIVYDNDVGVEVDDTVDGVREEVSEVDAGVVEWLIECAADGGGDFVLD